MSSVDVLSQLALFLLKRKAHIFTGLLTAFSLGYLYFEGMPFQKAAMQLNVESMLLSKNQDSFAKGVLEMQKDPKYLKTYAGLAAQRLIAEGKEKEALSFFSPAIAQLDNTFSDFVKISNKITAHKIKEALVDGYHLKNRLMEKKQLSSVLYPLTLLRISLLEKELKNADKELIILNELEEYLNEKSHRNFASMALSETERPTLIDYIAFRKSRLR